MIRQEFFRYGKRLFFYPVKSSQGADKRRSVKLDIYCKHGKRFESHREGLFHDADIMEEERLVGDFYEPVIPFIILITASRLVLLLLQYHWLLCVGTQNAIKMGLVLPP